MDNRLLFRFLGLFSICISMSRSNLLGLSLFLVSGLTDLLIDCAPDKTDPALLDYDLEYDDWETDSLSYSI